MDFLQSEWFTWVVAVIVLGSIIGAFVEGFESAGFEEGQLWGYTKKFVKLTLGYLLLPIIIWFNKD